MKGRGALSRTFVIADLHGRYDLLALAIQQIEDISGDGGTIVFTGDYVDRGPWSRQVIERLISGPADPKKWRWVCLRGNHEDMMVAALADPEKALWQWLCNGGDTTLVSYGGGDESFPDPAARVPEKHVAWLKSLPYLHTDRHRLFVHAGVKLDVPLDAQSEHDMLWMRYQDDDENGYGDKHIVHGHHAFENGPRLLRGRTNLDTLAWFTGRLSIGVFEDQQPGGPASVIAVNGPPIENLQIFSLHRLP